MMEWNRFQVRASRDEKSFGRVGFEWTAMGKNIFMAALCVLALALFGCSAKSSVNKKTVTGPTDTTKDKIVPIASVIDSLISANKGKGKGVVTGYLAGEGKSVAMGLLKQASNAAGERRFLRMTTTPLKAATVLIFNALKPTTAADTTLTTSDSGTYTCVLPEGKYFGFAVYLDLETFQLVTTQIPNMNPRADTVIHMDTATAVEDVTAPTVSGVYDASIANSDGVFLVGSVPATNAKVNITFSEPMSRESAKGVLLGKIDTTNTSTSLILADTVTGITMTWSGDSKQLTLSVASLTEGAQYGLIIPVSVKDLAKNALEKAYKATFVTVSAKTLAAVPFAVGSTSPADKETLKPIQNPAVSFNRPVENFSVLKAATISPAITGYWEVNGARVSFIHKDPLVVGKTYTVTLPKSIQDLSGQTLASDYSFSFTVKDFDGAAKDNTGRSKEVALAVEAAFDAYLAGDIGRFGAAFGPTFRLYSDDGSVQSKSDFLDKIRKDQGDQQARAAGFPAPVFDNSPDACKDGSQQWRWKVAPQGGSGDYVWVSAYVNQGQSPGVWDKSFNSVAVTDITWDPTGPRFTYKGNKYGYGPDMTKMFGPVNMDAAKQDLHFMSDLLKQTSTVVLEDLKMDDKTEFQVDPNITMTGKNQDSAVLAVKMIDYQKYNRNNFGDGQRNCSSALSDTSFQVLKFSLYFDGSQWLVSSILSSSKGGTAADYNKTVDTKSFEVKQILPITLTSPSPMKENAADADGNVTFKFTGIKSDSVGGYLVGLAEDPKFVFGRPPFGALVFVKASKKDGTEESLVLGSKGQAQGTNATLIARRVQDLKLPGWDRTMFENMIFKLVQVDSGFGGVYNWKVIALKDSTAAGFLASGFNPQNYIGESDFGPNRGYFACKAFPTGAAFNTLQQNQQQFVTTQAGAATMNSFSDMDMDGYPDAIEVKYHTNPLDKSSYPDFRIDTDGDGLPDFLEALLDPKGTDSLVTKKADAAGVKAEIAKLQAMGIQWIDSDGDGFPDDIEILLGFNPQDPKSNPGTRVRATAPIGVFSGKLQMSNGLQTLGFRLYTDSLKNLWAAYTAVLGSDTLTDTVRAFFNDGSGEVYLPIAMPKNGPDAGRSMLLRGHYDANSSLMMGPVDMIQSVAKTSVAFGSGPYVSQFAASGRGEDVSKYLGGGNGSNGGTGGNITTGSGTMGSTMPATSVSYRMPPTGVSEGSKLVFANGMITMIDDFGDTLAVIDGLSFRSQPDGSFTFDGMYEVHTGIDYKHSDVGGTIMKSGDGWVVDGHFYQESSLAGVRKQIPGQINAKAALGDIKLSDGTKLRNPMPQIVEGVFKGWIAQDKSGQGFQSQPVTSLPICPTALATNCQMPTTTCDPTKGACNQTTTCPAGQNCTGTTTTPVGTTSFSKSFMAGKGGFKNYLTKFSFKDNEYFYVSMGGRVYRVKNDSTHVLDAVMPWCGQVVLKLEAVPAKDDSATHKASYLSDSMGLPMGSMNLVILLEDQYTSGMPSILDKARDAQGDVHNNVFAVEIRPAPMEYGTLTGLCAGNNPGTPVTNPTCDPTRGTCAVTTCDPTKGTCPVTACDPTKGTCPVTTCDPTKGTCPVTTCDPTKGTCAVTTCDPTKGTCPVTTCDPTKGTCPVTACDPSKGACPGSVTTSGLTYYFGAVANVQAALTATGYAVLFLKDSLGNTEPALVDPSSLNIDTAHKAVVIKRASGSSDVFVFLAQGADVGKLMLTGSTPVVVRFNTSGSVMPPVDTTHVSGTTPPDTTKPPMYKGTIDNLRNVLASKNNKVKVQVAGTPFDAAIDPATLNTDGVIFFAADASNPTQIYIFLGDKMEPAKPALAADGNIAVMPKVAMAGL